jgi:hypothetical protein
MVEPLWRGPRWSDRLRVAGTGRRVQGLRGMRRRVRRPSRYIDGRRSILAQWRLLGGREGGGRLREFLPPGYPSSSQAGATTLVRRGDTLNRWRGPARVLALALLLLASPITDRESLAHQPSVFQPGRVLSIDDPLLSYALYGEFQSPTDVFETQMVLERPLAIPIEVLVPRRDNLETHRPIFAIVGPGLPQPNDDERALLPRPVPEGFGVVIGDDDRRDREVIFESFTRRVFWTNGPTAYVLPAGDVRIWIWSPSATTGKFVLGLGVEEGAIDWGNIFDNWSDFAY